MADLTQPVLETRTQMFLDELESQNPPPLYTLSYADARQVLEDVQAIEVEPPPVDVQDVTLAVGPTGEVSIRIYRPSGLQGKLPVVMYFHGGGWVLGSARTHDRLVCDLVQGSQAAFVFVNYTPSPEAQFPVPVEQAYAATAHLATQGHELELDGSRLAVAGDSVGGNMAAAVALLAKERGGPQIALQTLLYPVTDSSLSQASYEVYAEGPWLTRKAMEWFWEAYAPNESDRMQIIAAPLKASLEQLRGLPPALVLVAECDVLRDEGEQYARKLMQAGVSVTALRVLATIHDFALLNALAGTPATRLAIEVISSRLAAALETGCGSH